MPVHPLADEAASLRSRTLTFLRSPVSHEFLTFLADQGHTFTMPAAWGTLSRVRQFEQLLKAEDRRVAGGTTYGLDVPVVDAVRAVAADRSIPLPFSEDVLPAPSGMLVGAVPLCDLPTASMTAVTWGPAMEGFGPGVHLTWWASVEDALREPGAKDSGREIPLTPDFDLHLPYTPIVDSRLLLEEVPSGLNYSAVPLRTVVAAWYALTASSTDISERRPEPSIGRALAAQKAKRRGVQVATVPSAEVLQQALINQAAAQTAKLHDEYGDGYIGGIAGMGVTTRAASDGVFHPELDHQLDAEGRHLARLYREAAGRWHRLEMEITQLYPALFELLEEWRAREYGQWQPWCWMPSLKVSAWLVRHYQVPLEQAMWDGPRIAALGAWRSGGRHTIHPAPGLLRQLASDRVPTDLPDLWPAPGLGLLIQDDDAVRLVIAYLDDAKDRIGGELVLIDDNGEHTRGLRDLTKITMFLAGENLTEAAKITQEHYDRAAVMNGQRTIPADEAMYAQHVYFLSYFTGLLSAVCAPDVAIRDAGALVGRKPPAPWPPEPGLLSEMQMWLLGVQADGS